MLPFPYFKTETSTTAEPPSKRSKVIKGPVYCLFPADVEVAASQACEIHMDLAMKMLIEASCEHEQLKNMKQRPKNRIVEEKIEQNFGSFINLIAQEISASIREVLSSKIYDHVENSTRNSEVGKSVEIKIEHDEGETLMLKAGDVARKLRMTKKYQVKFI